MYTEIAMSFADDSTQYGFISGRSTTLQLLRVLDEWTKILESGDSIDVIYMDFMKAFDKATLI